MQWLSKIPGNTGTTETITVGDKEVSVYCTRRAVKALAKRKSPLFVEIELAFACIARKAVHFHESAPAAEVITLNDRLALQVTTQVPDSGESGTPHGALAQPELRRFFPKWIRLDYTKGCWHGEYGL